MTTAEADYVKAKTSVWWDIENCEVPKSRDANTIVQNVISALSKMNYCGPVSIFACGDTNLIPLPTLQALSSTGVRLNHVPAGVKDASDKKILVDMLLWAMDNPAPANIMLISGDRDFSYALHHLGMRQYNIILAQPPRASAPLVAAARNVWLWTSLASGGPPLPSGESSQLVNNIRCHVSNKEVSNSTVSVQVESSKPIDFIPDTGDTKDYKTGNKSVPKGICQETRRNMLENSSRTTSDSSQLVNNGRCHASDYEVPKYPVSEQHQSSKPTDSTSDSGGSPQDKRKNISQNGVSVTASRVCNVVCDSSVNFTKHLADKRNISQAAFVDNHRAQASVSVKPKQEAVVVEPVLCKVCQISYTNSDAYRNHTYGKRHQDNLELQSGKYKNNLVALVEPSKEGLEKHKKNKKAIESRAKSNADFTCRMCDAVCHTQTNFDSHLRGKKHTNMLSQSEALIDSKKLQEKGVGEKDQQKEIFAAPQLQSQKAEENSKFLEKHVSMVKQSKVLVDPKKLQGKGVEEKDQPKEKTVQPKANANHVCRLCNVVCLSQIDFDSHLRGQKHAAKLSQSKEGVREKDQPRETNAEPPNSQENRKCSKKHVVMVNESEELINTRKLDGKDVQHKAQSFETITKPQSMSQNTREHTEELRKICGASESTVKKPFPSTKDKQIPNGGSFSDFEVGREARPVNLFKGATEHSREMKMKKEMMVRQAVHAVHKLCPHCIVFCDSQGLSTVVCDFEAQWQRNAKNAAAAFVASNDAQSSASTKPVKEPEGLQPVWCQVCQISCNNRVVYENHTSGKKHRQNLELQSAEKNENMSKREVKLSQGNSGKPKKVPCNTFDLHLKSQKHSDMVTEQAEALVVDSRKIREETKQEIVEALKVRHIRSENLLHRVFTEQIRESRIPNELRGCVDVIPERMKQLPNLSMAKKLEDESQHPGEASKKVETKDQTVDSFWTRLWGKKP